jgi:NAD(P)H-dependent flavin oxidoreductase YrpB (nitropropane dioxygenase family)
VVNLEEIAKLDRPFWVAGGTGRPGQLQEVKKAGGAGIQVGTLFAYCRESGLLEGLKRKVLELCRRGEVDVLTADRASPTGFPFKTVSIPRTLSDAETYAGRKRVCDLGYLRTPFRMENGRIGYRCPAEPVSTFVKKGGGAHETEGRRCLCNALLANVGFGQSRNGNEAEKPLLTSGDDLKALAAFLNGRASYSAREVIDYLLT